MTLRDTSLRPQKKIKEVYVFLVASDSELPRTEALKQKAEKQQVLLGGPRVVSCPHCDVHSIGSEEMFMAPTSRDHNHTTLTARD